MIKLTNKDFQTIELDYELLVKLFGAVDDYLYSPDTFAQFDKGYPEGYTNPDKLDALRSAFLECSNSSHPETIDDVIHKVKTQQLAKIAKV